MNSEGRKEGRKEGRTDGTNGTQGCTYQKSLSKKARKPQNNNKNHLYLPTAKKADRNFSTLDTQLVENAINSTIYWRQRT
jgi:hypothetical protein